MRVVLLSILFLVLIYEFAPGVKESFKSDSIKLSMSAIRRKISTKNSSIERAQQVIEQEIVQSTAQVLEDNPQINKEELAKDDSGEKLKSTEWNGELKDFLAQVDPENGSDMYEAYVSELENYQKEFNILTSERANLYYKDGKSSKKLYEMHKEEIEEYDALIVELETRHDQKLKDILGAYYDQVRDFQNAFNENSEDDSENDGRVSHTL